MELGRRRQIFYADLTFVIVVLAGLAHLAMADGCFVSDNYEQDVYAPDQKVAIAWDGHRETMILSTKLQSDALANFGWIIPIKSTTKPEVELGDVQIFHDLSDYFKPTRFGRSLGGGAWGIDDTPPETVEVIETKELDVYDITVLKATDPEDLGRWLATNGFTIPASAGSILARYTNDTYYFLAVRLDLLNEHQDDIDRLKKYDVWDTVKGVAGCVPTKDHRSIRRRFLYLIRSKGAPYIKKHFAVALAEDVALCIIQREPYPEGFTGYFPRDDYDSLMKKGPEAAPSDIESIRDAVFKLCQTIVQLRRGTAKPLKISFTPSKPFFPLHISSINESNVVVTAYVLARQPLKDENATLKIFSCKELTCGLRKKMGTHFDLDACRYVTKLTFEGPSSGFDKDACFAPMNDAEKVRHTDRIGNFDTAIQEGDIAYIRDHIRDIPDLVEFLLSQGTDPNARSEIGETPPGVGWAQPPGQRDVIRFVEFLLHTGIDINATNRQGQTVLHVAASRELPRMMVAFLLSHGADPAARDRWGKTALDYAEERGDAAVIELLRKSSRANRESP